MFFPHPFQSLPPSLQVGKTPKPVYQSYYYTSCYTLIRLRISICASAPTIDRNVYIVNLIFASKYARSEIVRYTHSPRRATSNREFISHTSLRISHSHHDLARPHRLPSHILSFYNSEPR